MGIFYVSGTLASPGDSKRRRKLRFLVDTGAFYRLSIEALAESWNRARSLAGQAIDLYLGERRLDARFVVNTRWRYGCMRISPAA